MSMFRKKDEGFTLVELMVVVLIIGILVAIAIPVFNTARANAQQRSCQSNMRTVEGAYQTWYANDPANSTTALDLETAGLFTGTDSLMSVLEPNYVKDEPTCPGGFDYSADYTADGLSVNVLCSSGIAGAEHNDR